MTQRFLSLWPAAPRVSKHTNRNSLNLPLSLQMEAIKQLKRSEGRCFRCVEGKKPTAYSCCKQENGKQKVTCYYRMKAMDI